MERLNNNEESSKIEKSRPLTEEEKEKLKKLDLKKLIGMKNNDRIDVFSKVVSGERAERLNAHFVNHYILGINPPKPEDFGLDASIYQSFKLQEDERKKLEEERAKLLVKRAVFEKRVMIRSFILSVAISFLWRIFSGDKFWETLIFTAPLCGALFTFVVLLILINRVNGEYVEFKKKLGSIEDEKKIIKSNVRPFAEALRAYYENKLDDFYNLKLYRKRSESSEFKSYLEQFDSMLNQAYEATSGLFALDDEGADLYFTRNLSVWPQWIGKYKDYILKRRDEQGKQGIFKQNETSVERGSLSDQTSRAVPIKKVLSPEESYRTPKQIDWEKLSKGRMATGLIGEEAVVAIEQEYLRSIHKNELANKIRHVSKEKGDGSGYDILSFFPDGKLKYIEVKSTTISIETPFYISRNEYGFLTQHPKDVYIYRVLLNREKTKVIALQVILSSDLLETKDLDPIQYEVRSKTSPAS